MTHMQLHTTCDDCVNLLQNAASVLRSCDEELETLYDEQYQSQLLANVASSKCHMCALLHSRIPQLSEPLDSEKELRIRVSKAFDDPLEAKILPVWVSTTGDVKICLGELRVCEAGHVNSRTVESSQTWSLEALHSIQCWLNQCTSCHDTCIKPQGPNKSLPLRLIDVNTYSTIHIQPSSARNQEEFDRLRLSKSDSVRIILTHSLSPSTEYLTLSHRWGSPPTIMLSRTSLIHFIDDVSPLLLKCAEATVFQHAIHVTRCLGFRYLWIDALCIMQDDEEEKKFEIMRMDEIYFNSTLNIAAAEADSTRGLVFDRRPLRTNPCMTTAKLPGTNESISLHVFGLEYAPALWEKPLNRRGWVFQERILSPRIVHFAEDKVFWECWTLQASEVLPEGFPIIKETYPTTRDVNFNKSIGIIPTTFDVQQIKWRWYMLVTTYSRTSLSFADDRLLAISAVAKRFCSAMHLDPSDYLVGMWQDDLPMSLLWSQSPIPGRSGPSKTGPNLEMKYAPSWSWASVMVSVEDRITLEPGLVFATEVINIEVKRRSENFFDDTGGRRTSRVDQFHSCEGGIETRIFIQWDTCRSVAMDEYFLLHIGRMLEGEADSDGETSDEVNLEEGLVLIRAAEHGTYKRVGVFSILLRSQSSGSKLEGAFKGEFNTLSKEDYLELHADGKYTINII